MQLKFIYLCKARKKNSSKSCSRHNTLKVKTFLKKLSKPQTKLLFSLNQSIPLQFEENKFNSTYIVHTLHGSRSPSPEPEPGARARSQSPEPEKAISKERKQGISCQNSLGINSCTFDTSFTLVGIYSRKNHLNLWKETLHQLQARFFRRSFRLFLGQWRSGVSDYFWDSVGAEFQIIFGTVYRGGWK